MTYNKMGIYINQPQSENFKIIYNKKDASKVKDPKKILKVNRTNIKFGKSKNLDARYREYRDIFGENTNFKIVLQIQDYDNLVKFENHLKMILEPYCLRSPSNNVQMEWMTGISFKEVEKIIFREYKKFIST